jgi:hypothetical protein
MPDTITLTSTSDTAEQVQAALGIKPAEVTPPVEVAPPVVAAGPEDEDDDDGAAAPVGETTPQALIAAKPPQAQGGIKRGKLQARIDELVGERNKAMGLSAAKDAELDALRQRLNELSTQPQKPATPAAPVVEPEAPKPPQVADFDNYEDYVNAAIQFKAESIASTVVAKTLRERDEAAQREAAQRQQDAQFQKYAEEVNQTKAEFPDFDQVVNRPDLPVSDAMKLALTTSGKGSLISYYFGKNPDECRRIFAMGNSPQAMMELGVLVATVKDKLAGSAASAVTPQATQATPQTQTSNVVPIGTAQRPATRAVVTKAPDPIEPIAGSGSTPTSVPLDQVPYQDYKTMRNREERRRMGR